MTYEITMSVVLPVNAKDELEAFKKAMLIAKYQKLELVPTNIRLWAEPLTEKQQKELEDATKQV